MIGFIVVVSTGMLAAGMLFLNSTQAQAEVGSASQSFSQLSSDISLVAFTGQDHARIDLGLSNPGDLSTTDIGVFRVQTVNRSDGSVEETVMEQRLGSVEYTVDQQGSSASRTVVYQSGGVWVRYGNDPNATVLEAAPKMEYRQQTLTLPLIVMNDSASASEIGDTVVIEGSSGTRGVYPNESENRTNPVEDKKIRLSYAGEYYMAWQQVFATQFDGEVSVDHENNTASVILVTPDLAQNSQSGTVVSYLHIDVSEMRVED
jgi:hypothetical protein